MTFFFNKNQEQEGKTGPVWGLVWWEAGGFKARMWEGEYGGNITHTCM
jgi:hypothetical protein